jgi:hypothetical protein
VQILVNTHTVMLQLGVRRLLLTWQIVRRCHVIAAARPRAHR